MLYSIVLGDTPLEKFEPHHEFLHKLDKAEQAGGLKVLKISNISYDSTRTPQKFTAIFGNCS